MQWGMSLRTGILITVLASVVATDLLATWAVNDRLQDGARRLADSQARGRAAMTLALVDERLATLAADAEAIALYPAVISAVESRNTPPLVRWADDVAAQQGIHVKVFDAQGTPLAHGHNPERLGPMDHVHDPGLSTDAPLLNGLRLALSGHVASGVEPSDEIGLAIRGFAPVRRQGMERDVVGAVMIADPLDHVLLSRLAGGQDSGVDLRLAQSERPMLNWGPYTCTESDNGSAAMCEIRIHMPSSESLDTTLIMTVPLPDVARAR
jgi:hypothetical protein